MSLSFPPTLRRQCFRLYWKAQRVIAPELRDAQVVYEDRLLEMSASKPRWLDLGCGHQVLQAWRGDAEQDLVRRAGLIVGIDLEHASLQKHRSIHRRVRGDLSSLPFDSESFDLVTANMVLEHLSDPAAQLREISRVLKPGGVMVALTPNRYGYQATLARLLPERLKGVLIALLQGRAASDVFPTYYRINTEAALRGMALEAGFGRVAVEHVLGDAQTAIIPPLAVMELLFIRLLMTNWLCQFRPNLIAVARKVTTPAPSVCAL